MRRPSDPTSNGSLVQVQCTAWTATVDPRSLEVTIQPHGEPPVRVSAPQDGLGPVESLQHTGDAASWRLSNKNVHVSFRADDGDLLISFVSDEPGSFTWPVVGTDPAGQAYLLPLAEGSYVPADDTRWLAHLVALSPMRVTEALSMPFWGLAFPNCVVTYMLTNQFNNEIAFEDCRGRTLMRLTHEFTPNRERKEYGFIVRLGPPSPLEPAKQYRRCLTEEGRFVSLRDKIRQVPQVEKLLGAAHIYLWGNGVSIEMVEKLAALGCERLWLGLASWQGGFQHPDAIRSAKDRGYLIATYDSYHGIHDPDSADAFDTVRFDRHLYETGPILTADGSKIPGYLGRGYQLSPIAAWPYVRKRVTRLMADLPEPFNSWFIDCDAYGEVFDDYSELHPATQQDDVQARLDRMAWIRDTYGLVIGSEGGVAYSAPVIHFAHGMMTPVFGWGDPDLQKDEGSPYYLGNWSPRGGPSILLRRVPLKPSYRSFYYDPRFRLPLYQAVFHDSVVATHHWHHSSLKFTDQVDTVELLELLYNVPPLYHMNLEELEIHKDRIAAHNEFFSPLHRQLALLPLTDFAWLTPDRMVQRTVFGAAVEMVANFAADDFEYAGIAIPGRSVLARRLETGSTGVYTPAPPSG